MVIRKAQSTGAESGPVVETVLHFIIPVYNKEGSLARNIGALDDYLGTRLGRPYEIVLSDDGSTDGSARRAKEMAAANPRLRAVGYPDNRGRGAAVKFAAESCPEGVVIYADLDFPQTSGLGAIPEMAGRLANSPVVIGSRFRAESVTKRLWRRSLVGRVHRAAVRLVFPQLDVSDPDMGFKGFRQPEFGRLNRLSRMNRWSWDLEVLVIARRNGVGIDELPVDWREGYEEYSTAVRLLRDSREELGGMLAIRKNLRRGRYDF
jgi:dolichyl-phosphate beta-glucosyltransferase